MPVFFQKNSFQEKNARKLLYATKICFALRNVAILGLISRRLSPIKGEVSFGYKFKQPKKICQVLLNFFSKKHFRLPFNALNIILSFPDHLTAKNHKALKTLWLFAVRCFTKNQFLKGLPEKRML
jgi:hypothetical protein